MQAFNQITEDKHPEFACDVAVIYEDAATRACAMQAHDYLMHRFGSEIEFSFHWWRADFLVRPETGSLAVADTENADIFIICTHPDSDISASLKQWLGGWSDHHAGHEGALLDLTSIAPGLPVHIWQVKVFLRELARRASLDYLEINPPGAPYEQILMGSIPQQKTTSTPPMDMLRVDWQPPSHYGLNE